jgi:hypothetical protein
MSQTLSSLIWESKERESRLYGFILGADAALAFSVGLASAAATGECQDSKLAARMTLRSRIASSLIFD